MSNHFLLSSLSVFIVVERKIKTFSLAGDTFDCAIYKLAEVRKLLNRIMSYMLTDFKFFNLIYCFLKYLTFNLSLNVNEASMKMHVKYRNFLIKFF